MSIQYISEVNPIMRLLIILKQFLSLDIFMKSILYKNSVAMYVTCVCACVTYVL